MIDCLDANERVGNEVFILAYWKSCGYVTSLKKSRGRGDTKLVQGVAGGVGPILVSNNKSLHLDFTRHYLIDYRVVSFLSTTGDGVSG